VGEGVDEGVSVGEGVDEGVGDDVGVGVDEDDVADVGDGGGVDDGVGANRCTIVRPPLDVATGAESCQESPIKNPTPNASGAMINTSRNSLSDLDSEII
jgi:hypothetical protein